MKSESNRPITIEDLLRLKRAERPPTEFWATFDQELRAKQLSALVGKRPWWQRIPAAFSHLMRYRIPLGASAVALLAFVSLRDNEMPGGADPVTAEPAAEAVAASNPADNVVGVPTATADVSSFSSAVAHAAPVAAVAPDSRAEAPAINRISPTGGVLLEAEMEAQSPAAKRTLENVAVTQAAERTSARSLLAVASGFEDRAMPSRIAVEPLQQMTPPSDSRRARMLTAMVSTASLESSIRTTERAANRIAQERLYDDQMSRFGARGDRLQVKF